jgi:dCMP deaminase
MKQKFRDAYMKTAETFAGLSSARRLHVGAIIVKDDRIISIGYNGMPAGWDNNCEYVEFMPYDIKNIDPSEIWHQWPLEGKFWIDGVECDRRYRLKTKPEVLHAESNAIAKLAKSTESGDGATMFITHAPCMDCGKLIFQSGINCVYYRNSYRNEEGINFLKKAGVKVEKL